ncbi:MAG TPA: STAS domain-containing protein [Planctomycetota bacterium]|nr:STAS domain-containing protein [Planctomycetota bacterium]
MTTGSTNFSLTTANADKGVTVVHIDGDIDAHTTKILQAKFGELYKTKHYKLIIDMAKVGYMSSSGASLLIVAQGQARENAGDVVLLNVNASVTQVMDLLGLTPLFVIAPNKAAAMSAFQ